MHQCKKGTYYSRPALWGIPFNTWWLMWLNNFFTSWSSCYLGGASADTRARLCFALCFIWSFIFSVVSGSTKANPLKELDRYSWFSWHTWLLQHFFSECQIVPMVAAALRWQWQRTSQGVNASFLHSVIIPVERTVRIWASRNDTLIHWLSHNEWCFFT